MKVLAINSVGYEAGGAETILVKIHPYLVDKGYSIRTLASDLGADREHFNDYTFKHISSTGPLKFLFFLFNPFSFFALKSVLDEYNPSLVHLHVMHEITPSVLFLLKKYPTVMTLHGSETFLRKLVLWKLKPGNFRQRVYDKKDLNIAGKFTYFYFHSIQKFFYNLALKNVDIFIAPSQYLQNIAKTDVSPIVHVPNFIEFQQFHELTNTYNVLFVGRLEKIKGVECLIRAVSFIIKVFPQTTLTIVGDGRDKTDLFSLAVTLQLEKSIHFAGWVDHKDLATYYEKASLVVIPSVVPENFPTVCNEAMSAGRPVVGTNVGGIPEMIDDGVNGYLVEPEKPEQIAEKVIKLFSEEKLLKALGKNARKKAEGFSIEKHLEKLDTVYAEIMNKYKLESPPNSPSR